MAKKYSDMECVVTPDGTGTYGMVASGLTRKQVDELEIIFAPRAKRWRGQYREMALAFVTAVRKLAIP